MKLITLKVEDDRDIVRLRSIGEEVVAGTGFAGFAATRIVTALLEMGRNLLERPTGGRVALLLSAREGRLELVVEAVSGSSHDSGDMGLGLRGVERIADRFERQAGREGARVIAAFRTQLAGADLPERAREISAALARLEQGDPAAMLARQNRDLLEALEQRDLLMAEIHHRTKNNLSLVIGLMRLSRSASASEETKSVLRDLEGRVSAIAKVHDQLQRTAAANTVDLMLLLEEVAAQTRSAFASSKLEIAITVAGDAAGPLVLASSAAVDLALVVGELLTNACKHAFEGRARGRIAIACRRQGDDLELVVRDNGVGLPPGVEAPERSTSLGWQMVRSMVQKHNGALETQSDRGLTVTMRFNTDLMGLEAPAPRAAPEG